MTQPESRQPTAEGRANKKQVKALQALWHVHARRTLGFDPSDRNLRLKYFSNFTQRAITSALGLTFEEARDLIQAFKKSLGQSDQRRAPRPRSREAAAALGREGRRDRDDNSSTLVDSHTLDIIRDYRERLMMNDAEYIAWLAGKSSPLKGRTVIRTLGDARQVQWALKGILKSRGLWR